MLVLSPEKKLMIHEAALFRHFSARSALNPKLVNKDVTTSASSHNLNLHASPVSSQELQLTNSALVLDEAQVLRPDTSGATLVDKCRNFVIWKMV